MKYLQRLLVLLTSSFIIFSCQKEYSVEKPTGSNNTNTQWEFKENGVQFKGPIDTASLDSIGTLKILSINGHSDDGISKISLLVLGTDIKAGVYKIPNSSLTYSGGNPAYATDQTQTDSFTITITKIDTSGVTGTFNGKVTSGTASKTIVDGKFAASFKSTVVTPPTTTDSGNVVLWSKAGCGGGTSTNPITVTLNGKSGQITTFVATEPTTCDPAGSLHYKLPVGSYSWVAKCGTDSVTGTSVITKGGCTKTQVDFTTLVTGDYFPMTKNSNWSYLYDASTPDDTLYTLSTGNTPTLGGKIYNLFTNTDGVTKDTSYYRKSGNTYYEYVPASNITDSGIVLSTPAFEYSFLIDNLTAGQTYVGSTVSATITSGGVTVPITMTTNSTILEAGVSATINGKSYTNVIKVKTFSSYKTGTVTTNYYAAEQWFSKGVGEIKYIDYLTDPFTTPTFILNLTRSQVY